MLTLTDNASEIVTSIVDRSPESDVQAGGGLRISTVPDRAEYAVTIVPAPAPDDQVIQNAGARVFLDREAAEQLSDTVLDARVDGDQGVRFTLARQG